MSLARASGTRDEGRHTPDPPRLRGAVHKEPGSDAAQAPVSRGRRAQIGLAKAPVFPGADPLALLGDRSPLGLALSHEMRTSLAAIRGAAQLLQPSLMGDDLVLAELIEQETGRIWRMIEAPQARSRPPNRARMNPLKTLHQACRLLAAIFPAVVVVIDWREPCPAVWGDSDEMLQVFLNLLKNAAEAMGEAGRVTVVATSEPPSRGRQEGWLSIVVADTGPGIDEHVRPWLFKPVRSAKPQGAGVGLAICAALLAANGGLIDVQSVPGDTRFTVRLSTCANFPSGARHGD